MNARFVRLSVNALLATGAALSLGWGFAAFAEAAAAPPPASPEALPISWVALAVAVLGALFGWYKSNVQPKVDAKLAAIVTDATKPKAERTAAAVALDLEPLILSAAGHVTDDVKADGTDLHQLSVDAAKDLLGVVDDGLKTEATKYFGSAGAGLVDFVSGLIKSKVQAAQGAKVAVATAAGASAAAAVTTGPAAVAAINAGG